MKIVAVPAFVPNAKAKDLCLRNSQMKVLRGQELHPKIWQLDIQRRMFPFESLLHPHSLLHFFPFLIDKEYLHFNYVSFPSSGFQRNGATVQNALLLDLVVLAVVVER